MSKKTQARIDELVANNDKEELVKLAGKLGASNTGTKAEIAAAIVEAEQADEADSDEADGEGDLSPSETGESEDALSIENRVARLERMVEANYTQFAAHTHNRHGTLELGEERVNEAPKETKEDQTTEAERRAKALARREEHVKKGGNPEDPLPENQDEEEEQDVEAENDETKPETTAVNAQATGK